MVLEEEENSIRIYFSISGRGRREKDCIAGSSSVKCTGYGIVPLTDTHEGERTVRLPFLPFFFLLDLSSDSDSRNVCLFASQLTSSLVAKGAASHQKMFRFDHIENSGGKE